MKATDYVYEKQIQKEAQTSSQPQRRRLMHTYRVCEDRFHEPKDSDRGVASDRFYAMVRQQINYWRNEPEPKAAAMEEYKKLIAKEVFNFILTV